MVMAGKAPFGKKMGSLKSKNYNSSIIFVRDQLQLGEKVHIGEMQALFISAANATFGEKTLDRDVVLMALGLAKGFDNIRDRVEVRDEKALFSDRCNKFLKISNYISENYKKERKNSNVYASYEDALERGMINSITNSLGRKAGRHLEKTADTLYEWYKKKNIEQKLKDSAKTYNAAGKEYISPDDLPSLVNLIVDTSRMPQPDSPVSTEPQDSAEPQGSREPQESQSPLKPDVSRFLSQNILISVAIVLALCFASKTVINIAVGRGASAAISVQNVSEPGSVSGSVGNAALPPVEKIDIGALEITMLPGSTHCFTPKVEPDAARGTMLSYSSSDPQLAAAYGEHNNTQCRIEVPKRERLGPLPASADITVTAPSWVFGTVEVKVVESVATPEGGNKGGHNETPVVLDEEGLR